MRELHFRKADESAESRKQEPGWTRRLSCLAVQGYLLWGINILMCQTTYAADIFDIAKSAMQKVCASICLFLMNFSKSGKTVDESRAWLKRIVVCWAVLMTLGAIVTYMEAIIPQQSFTP